MPNLPVEDLTAEERRALRDRHRRQISSINQGKPDSQVLADIATRALDVQHSLEDQLITATALAAPPPAATLNGLRAVIPAVAAIFGRATAAAKFDCASLVDTIDDDELPGLSPAQLRSIRSTYQSQVAAAVSARARESSTVDRRRRLQMNLASATSTLDSSVAATPAAPQPTMPPPVPARKPYSSNPRSIYPCRSCNVLGHWREDNVCKPEDVRANIQRLSAMLNPGLLALPPPTDGSGMRFCSL